MKIAYWDLETSDLNGDFGRLLCASILSLPDETMISYRQDDYVRRKKAKSMADDHAIAVDIRDTLETFHITAGWYSKGFDIPFLNTRLAAHGERRLNSKLHLDGVWYAKGWRGIKAKSGKLADVAVFFGLDERKMAVEPEEWIAARAGDKDAMDIAIDRCESDVRLTRSVVEQLLDINVVANIQRYP